MAKQEIDRGTKDNPKTGDSLYEGAKKINENFTELYNRPIANVENPITYKVIEDNFDFTSIPVGYDNSTWIITYNHDLLNNTIILPTNVTLSFKGGKLSNGTLTGDNTKIEAGRCKILDSNLLLDGVSWVNSEYKAEWFGVVGDDLTDNTNAMNYVSNFITLLGGGTLTIGLGIYLMQEVFIKGRVKFIGNGWGTIIRAKTNPTNGILNIINPEATIQNLRIEGNLIADKGVRIYNNSQGSNLEGCKITTCNTYALDVENSNILDIRRNAFNAPVYLNGADNSFVFSNTFEFEEDRDFALKIETTGVNKTAHNCTVSSNWFETSVTNNYRTAIIANANSVSIVGNHFQLINDIIIQAIQVGVDSDRCFISYNNFQSVGSGLVLDILLGAQYTHAFDNRGLGASSSYNNSGSNTVISDSHIITSDLVNYRKLGSDISNIKIDVLNSKIQIGDNVNNYLRKSGADFIINANSKIKLRSNGTSVEMEAFGTNGTISLNSPSRIRNYTTASRPTASNYSGGVQIWNTTTKKINISDGVNWYDAIGVLV